MARNHIGRWEGGATAPPSTPPGLRLFFNRGGFGPRTDPERTPNEACTPLERISNGTRTDPARTPCGHNRADPVRILNGARTNPERTSRGPRTDPQRPRTEIFRSHNFRNSITNSCAGGCQTHNDTDSGPRVEQSRRGGRRRRRRRRRTQD